MQVGARPTRDQALVQIVDSALADATRRSGHWLVCRPGCTQCCIGPFPINQRDAARLQQGLRDLEKQAPERAARVRERARESVARLSPEFPGDPATGLLHECDLHKSGGTATKFSSFGDEQPCPSLLPQTSTSALSKTPPVT